MNPSETSDGLEYELDAFQRGFAFWDSPKAQYLPPIDDAGRRRYRDLCPRFPTVIIPPLPHILI
jgi:hypothetical protein